MDNWMTTVCAGKLSRGEICTEEDLLGFLESKLAYERQYRAPKDNPDKFLKERKLHFIRMELDQNDNDQMVFDYNKKGIEVEVCPINKKISKVKIKFSKSQWLDLLNTEGDLLPHSCSVTSKIRNILFNIVRNDNWCSFSDLGMIVRLVKELDFEKGHPLNKLIKIWRKVKFDSLSREDFTKTVDLDDPQKTIDKLSELCNHYSWRNFIRKPKNKDAKTVIEASNEKDLFLIMQYIRTLYNKLSDVSTGSVEVYLVMSKNKPVEFNGDLLVFATKEKVQKFLRNKNKLYFVKAKISMEKGIEILEEFK